MLKKTVDRIVDNYDLGIKTVIGAYTYALRYNWETESWWIYRCKTENVGYTWIKHDGEFVDAWTSVVEVQR